MKMKRIIAASLIAGFTATSAFAGGLGTIIEEPEVEITSPSSSGAGWAPLAIFIALVAIAASASE